MLIDQNITDIEVGLFVEAVLKRYDYDFSSYAKASLKRRIQSLAESQKVESISCLIPKVLHEKGFIDKILKHLSVQVSEMFRDPWVFKKLRETVFPALATYPQINTLVMQNVPGSMDDEINLLASMEIRNRGINTHIPAGGMVASGGTDMFLAGVKRSIAPGAKIGVHSWNDGSGKAALDYPRDHQAHVSYLDYYKAIGITTDFYWYTLEAAPAEGNHWMTAEEMVLYGVLIN